MSAMLVTLLSAPAAVAQSTQITTASADFDADGIANFCSAVVNPLTQLDPSNPAENFGYHTYLFRWAGVLPNDPAAVVREKVRHFLNGHTREILCSHGNVQPDHANILKMAVARQSDEFIDDALDNWHMDLNQVDVVDGRTVLDYLRDRIASLGPSSTSGQILTGYYERFRAAGAKHASELDQ